MESIRAIQEMVDEHKEEMPTGLVTSVMEECQKAYNSQPKLYKITYTLVHTIAYHSNDGPEAKMVSDTMTVLAQSVAKVTPAKRSVGMFLTEAKFISSWLKLDLPDTLHHTDEQIVILHSITPFS